MSPADPNPAPFPPLARVLGRSWLVISLLVILGMGGGGAWGWYAPVQYVAQAQVIAGATSVSAAAVPSFAEAGRSLAETYSRVFASDAVRKAVGSSADVKASPVAGSSIILIEARGSTPKRALDTGNAGVDALLTEVSRLLSNDGNAEQARKDLDAANIRLVAAQDALSAARARQVAQQIGQLQAEVQSAQAAVNAYNSILTDALSNNVQANGLQRLASAHITSTTKRTHLEMGVAAGTVAGLLLGLAFAYRREAWRRRRVARR